MSQIVRLALLALLALAAVPAHAQLLRIPGTKVSLEALEGFELSTQFAGLQSPEQRASIMISEVPSPIAQLLSGFTEENLRIGGLTLQSTEQTSIDGRPARLLLATQTSNGITFEKWMGAVGDATTSVLIVATFPQARSLELSDRMRATVLSARWDPSVELEVFEGLPFRIRESADLKIRNRVQNMLLLAIPGGAERRSPTEPFLVIGSSFGAAEISDVEEFALERITQTAQIVDLAGVSGRAVQISGRPGWELIGRARDRQSGTSLGVYQLIVVDGTTYFVAQGMAGERLFERYLPQFRAIAESLEIR